MTITAEKIIEIVAKNIRAERKRVGLSQTQLAEKIGVTHRYVQRIESTPKNLSIKSLNKFATAFGVPITSLLAGVDPQAHGKASDEELDALRLAVRVIEGYLVEREKESS